MFRKKSCIAVGSCLLSLALITAITVAQDENKATKSKSPKAKEEVKGRLPIYFGQIGLSGKQEDEVRKAAQPFEVKIVALRKQIEDLETQIDEQESLKLAACEKLLNENQKTALKGRRESAEAEKAAKKKTTKTSNGDSATEEKNK